MRVTGIIAEYNPFHNGHLYQIQKTRECTNCDFIIIVMSGNFTQRGLPSILDKYTRTQMALLSGADLVIELPMPFSTASAERFSEAGISLLNKTGVVDTLCFGSECGDTELLYLFARTLSEEPIEVSAEIQRLLGTGLSYPRARVQAINTFFKQSDYSSILENIDLEMLMSSPNNILGIEYIKAILKYKTPIVPLTIKRKTAHYHDTTIYDNIASASAIREQIYLHHEEKIKQTMPTTCYHFLLDTLNTFPSIDDFSILLQHKLIVSTLEDLYTLWDIPYNLCRSIFNSYESFYTFSELANHITSKTYTKATVGRALLRVLLDVKASDMNKLKEMDWIPYIHVLGCKKDALGLLSHLSKVSTVPVITNLAKSYPHLTPIAQRLIDYEVRATSYYYCAQKQPHKYKEDFRRNFIVL